MASKETKRKAIGDVHIQLPVVYRTRTAVKNPEYGIGTVDPQKDQVPKKIKVGKRNQKQDSYVTLVVAFREPNWYIFKLLLHGTSPVALEAASTHDEWSKKCVGRIVAYVQKDVIQRDYIYITDFYTRLQNDQFFAETVENSGTVREKTILRGLGHSAMCAAVEYLTSALVQNPTYIVLQAAGQMISGNEDAVSNPDLPLYYFSLGFMYPQNPCKLLNMIGYSPGSTTKRLAKECKRELAYLKKRKKTEKITWNDFQKSAGWIPMWCPVSRLLDICKTKAKHILPKIRAIK
jgi:hypothetical protein